MMRSHQVTKAVRQPTQMQTRQFAVLSISQSRHHSYPRQIQMMTFWPHWRTHPNSHVPTFKNEFKLQDYEKHLSDKDTASKWPQAKPDKLWQSTVGDPHAFKGWFTHEYSYHNYCVSFEPSFPPMPNVKKGELLAGAQFYRTQGWMEAMSSPTEPAITTVGRLDPDNQRPVDSYHMPDPDSITPDGEYDIRTARLPVWHADRRPIVYFITAGVTAGGFAFVRGVIASMVYIWWPAKDVFSAGVVEVDLRPVREGQNFVVKWRNKPVFFRRRTEAMIELARADDDIIGSMRDPQTDAQRAPRPEWLIVVGVCTHLGCIPYPDQGNFGGYFCPCHGSHYDHSGRIRIGPAPKNLEVPPYTFLDDVTVKVG